MFVYEDAILTVITVGVKVKIINAVTIAIETVIWKNLGNKILKIFFKNQGDVGMTNV